jgi:hypothetical protein
MVDRMYQLAAEMYGHSHYIAYKPHGESGLQITAFGKHLRESLIAPNTARGNWLTQLNAKIDSPIYWQV